MPRKVTPPDTAATERRKYNAERLIYRTVFKGQTAADAWSAVHPKAKCSRASAGRQARREMDWYRTTYPLEARTLLYLNGIGDDHFVARLKEGFTAVMPEKVTTTARGETIRERYVIPRTDEPGPDPVARADAMQKRLTVGGLAGKRAAQPAARRCVVSRR